MINRKGFTVIEVLVVLAIGGLILMIVLLAVPSLLRQSRNTRRIADTNALIALAREQLSNSQTGAWPLSCDNTQSSCFLRQTNLSFYDNSSTSTPMISYYRNSTPFNASSAQLSTTDSDVAEKVIIHTYAICNGNSPTGTYASPGSVIIQYAIETFGGPKLVCKGI